jgi:5-methyltetrahydrofolate--homocysteine methyltransferase
MQPLKEDMAEAQARLAAWWDHEATDRPVIAYTYTNPQISKIFWTDHWFPAKFPEKITEFVDQWEQAMPCTVYGGEKIPSIWPNYGPGIIAAVLGVEPKFVSNTMWFDRPTALNEIVTHLESIQLNANNSWYHRLLIMTEALVERSQGRYCVGFTDLGGVLDILASFLTPKDILIAMQRQPGIIDQCRAIILEKWNRIYDDLQRIIARARTGYNAWLGVWCPKPWYPLQCDFAYMLSPKFFRRFVLPDLIEQANHLSYSIYHLDGANQLPYLDDLLKSPITGIQWVPGAQGPEMTHDKWIPVYKKIQAAGKNIVMDADPQSVAKMYRQYDARGLYVSTHFGSQILAEFYLPKFMGGMEGIEPDDD